MGTFLLTWNPDRWPWRQYKSMAAQVAAGETVTMDWSTGVRRDLPEGSRLFLLRQGVEPRGIVASGVAAGPVHERPHYDAERAERGDTALMTPIAFEALLDVSESAPLSRNSLDDPELSSVNWNTAGGGIRIDEPVASELERRWAVHLGMADPAAGFRIGCQYNRFEILARLGLPVVKGGDPFTGYFRRGSDFVVLATLSTAPRATGHAYPNAWEGDLLKWYTKSNASESSPQVREMLSDSSTVHVFTRNATRESFRYEGVATPESVGHGSPALIRWRFGARVDDVGRSLGDATDLVRHIEGASKSVVVNAVERDPAARAACIGHYGSRCQVCGMSFAEEYGPIGEGFIHVHHLEPLKNADGEREVDPVRDLRPVCPNCHAMLHRRDPPLGLDAVRDCLESARSRLDI